MWMRTALSERDIGKEIRKILSLDIVSVMTLQLCALQRLRRTTR